MSKEEKPKEKKDKVMFSVGKRKTSVARASIKSGNGKVVINSTSLDLYEPETARLKIREPLMIADALTAQVDIKVTSRGGGVSSQTDAIRQAIAKAMVEFSKDAQLKQKFHDHDRGLLVYDYRRTEPHKPSRSSQGARRHKQRSKR